MKFIENKINNFSKPYVAPRIRIVGVEEECGLLAGGSLDGEKDGSNKSQGDQDNPLLGGAKRSAILINDDDESE